MIRIWALALAFIVCIWLIRLMGDLGGTETLLTGSAPVGAGLVTAFLIGGAFFTRAVWLTVGVLIGALGFVIGAGVMTDNATGLALGSTITVILMALLTFWTRRQAAFLAAVLGSGSVTAVYAFKFNLDPQSLNVSLPIAIGQTILPLGLGFAAGMVCRTFLPDDDVYEEARRSTPPPTESSGPAPVAEAAPAATSVSGADILPGRPQ